MNDAMELEKIIRDICGQALSESTALVLLHILTTYKILITRPNHPLGIIREHTQRHACEVISKFHVEGHPDDNYAPWYSYYNQTIPHGNFYEMPEEYQPEIASIIVKLTQHPKVLSIDEPA